MGRKEQIEKQSVRRSQHGVKCKPIMASICLCQRFHCSTLRGKQQTVVDIVSRSLLHVPIAEPVDIFSSHLNQICELRTGYMVSHSERSPEMCCKVGFNVTLAQRARKPNHFETDLLCEFWKGATNSPLKKGRSLCLCGKYWVKYRYDLLTNLTIWPILIAWWHVYEPDGRVGCVTYSYADEIKGECMYK